MKRVKVPSKKGGKRYQQGGFTGEGKVPNALGSGQVDDVPAMLTAGEYVIRREAVDKYGTAFLDKINSGALNPTDTLNMNKGGKVNNSRRNKYQTGGTVTPNNNSVSTTPINSARRITTATESKTSTVANHAHDIVIYPNGTVIIKEAIHPEVSTIRHTHQYIGRWPNGYVTKNASACWPNCEELHGVAGAPLHSHEITLTNLINNTNSTQINNYNKGGLVRRIINEKK